jgi:hypothetical protein
MKVFKRCANSSSIGLASARSGRSWVSYCNALSRLTDTIEKCTSAVPESLHYSHIDWAKFNGRLLLYQQTDELDTTNDDLLVVYLLDTVKAWTPLGASVKANKYSAPGVNSWPGLGFSPARFVLHLRYALVLRRLRCRYVLLSILPCTLNFRIYTLRPPLALRARTETIPVQVLGT